MKATIRDAATLSTIRPLEVVSYLRAAGWKKESEQAGKWATWVREIDGEEYEVAVPLTTQYRDFALRMSDILQVLEVAEKRTQLEIFQDLLFTSADIVRVRLADSELAEGSVPLEEGAQFFQKAKDMMLAAACAAAGPRAYFSSRRPAQALEYLRRTRLGQTEHGSFVLTIISRVPPSLSAGNGILFEVEEPFERRVTQMLAQSLAAVRTASDDAASSGQVKSFETAVSKGVNANLCDALVGMGTAADTNRSLEVQFSWSSTRPLTPSLQIPNTVFFPPDAFPMIKEAAVYLKETSSREEFEARGPVVKLERADGVPAGKVTVHCFVDEQPRKVTVELGDEQYQNAVTAHKEGQVIRCSGVLMREGRAFRLHEPYNFVVEEEE